MTKRARKRINLQVSAETFAKFKIWCEQHGCTKQGKLNMMVNELVTGVPLPPVAFVTPEPFAPPEPVAPAPAPALTAHQIAIAAEYRRAYGQEMPAQSLATLDEPELPEAAGAGEPPGLDEPPAVEPFLDLPPLVEDAGE
jgi:hypothetical protein